MTHPFIASSDTASLPIWLVTPDNWEETTQNLPSVAKSFARAQGFKAGAGELCLLPDVDGNLVGVLFGLNKGKNSDPFLVGKLPNILPDGTYHFATKLEDARLGLLAWLLGSYTFDRYTSKPKRHVKIVAPDGIDSAEISRIAKAVSRGRDLINTPTNDLGPDGLEAAAQILADQHYARVSVITGEALLTENFPMIHAVGRASATAPRLIDIIWGEDDHPRVTLVGKGVAFDTGGLNLKPGSSMALMKKDMGGAATALACAEMIMGSKLPIRLRLLIPAVENSVSSNSFRPGDVLPSRKGLSVEIGNTDAEGRLILGDALAYADEEEPQLIVDFATLTGAARVATGPDLPPFYTDNEILAADIARIGSQENDPVWRMPLWQPYASWLDSKIADINHISSQSFAGSVTAALFLKRFVEKATDYVHFDVYGWSGSDKPGRPQGGEIQAARLVYALLKERFANN